MKKEDIKPGMFLKSTLNDSIMFTSRFQSNEGDTFDAICIKSSNNEIWEYSNGWGIKYFEPITFSEAFKEEIEKEFESTLNEFTKEKLDLVERNQELQNEYQKAYDKVQALQHEINQSKKEFTNYTELYKTYYQYYKNEVEKNQLLRKENESLKHELKETITAYDELENKKFDTVTVSTATKINSLTESNRKLQQENSKLKNSLVKMILEGRP